jgi:hypothetical protein
MNIPTTLRDKLRVLVSTERPPRDVRELLDAELREKNAVGFRAMAFFDSLNLDFALFFHKYITAWVVAALLLAVVGGWIAFVTLVQPPVAVSSKAFAEAAPPTTQTPTATIRPTAAHAIPQSVIKVDAPIATRDILSESIAPLAEEHEFATIEPLEPARAMPNVPSRPTSLGHERLRFPDPPLDYSGFVASVSYEQSSIPVDPAHPEFATASANDLNYQMGYCFNRYNEAGIGYSRHVYRQITSTTWTLMIGGTVTHQTTWQPSDDPISLPGIYYTLHANDLDFLGIEPFATVFASNPSAGFLWRASAGIEWNPWQNLNAVISYSREQLNAAAYAAPQNGRDFFSFGLSYRLLP